MTEAVSNVVKHAYRPSETGAVHVAADVENATLEVVIADDGDGFRPGQDESAAGLGLPVIASSAADLGITQRQPRGTEVWMRFMLPR